MPDTFMQYLDQWNSEVPDKTWLRERCGDETRDWTWREAHEEIFALGAWLEQNLEGHGHRCLLYTSDAADDRT